MKGVRAVSVLFLAACVAPTCCAVTPVVKVLELLRGMLDKAKAAQHEEVVQWTAYKQWCSDAELQRQAVVKSADLQIERMNADIEKFDAEVTRLENEVKGHSNDLLRFAETLQNATAQRADERKAYEAAHRDYSESARAVADAIDVLKKQDYQRPQAAALLQGVNKALGSAARRAFSTLLADGALERPGMALLAEAAPGEANAYEFQSGDVVTLLQELRDKLRDEVTALQKEEMERRHAYERIVQDLASQTSAAKNEQQKKTKGAAENKEASVKSGAQLDSTSATRDDDAKFLEDLDSTCNQKADEFEARQKLRHEEVQALQKVVGILSGASVAGAAEKHLPTLAQQATRKALLQLRSASPGVANSQRVATTAAYLQKAGYKLGSSVLSTVAGQISDGGDPFEKVKALIQNLISRLTEEAKNEAQHKDWCDEELQDNGKTRTSKSQLVESLRTTIDQLESDIALATKELADLSKAVAQLETKMAEALKIRNAEKAQNEDTIADAAGAQMAVADGIKILKEYYGTAAQAPSSFVQRGAQPVAPVIFSAPFEGLQPESNNVVAFLEVIQSDFARLEQETSQAERTAQGEYEELVLDAQADLKAKSGDITAKTKSRAERQQDLQTAANDLELAQSELDSALAYYEKLKPSCVVTSTERGYSERVKRREEEIAALSEALDILSGETVVGGPDSLYSSVDGGNRGWDVGVTFSGGGV